DPDRVRTTNDRIGYAHIRGMNSGVHSQGATSIASLRWWMAPAGQADDQPAAGVDDAVLGACRALVRHRYGKWLSKVDAGRRLIGARYQPVETIEQSIAARFGEPPPSGRQARTFQEGVLHELLAAT
ncbi:hypothetical protein ACWEQY_22490, partial [Rhodococcus pyridinivorans]